MHAIAGRKSYPLFGLYDAQKMANAATLKFLYLYALIFPQFTATYPKNEGFCMHFGASGVWISTCLQKQALRALVETPGDVPEVLVFVRLDRQPLRDGQR